MTDALEDANVPVSPTVVATYGDDVFRATTDSASTLSAVRDLDGGQTHELKSGVLASEVTFIVVRSFVCTTYWVVDNRADAGFMRALAFSQDIDGWVTFLDVVGADAVEDALVGVSFAVGATD